MAAGPTPNPDDPRGPDDLNGPDSPARGGRLPVWGIAVMLLAVALIGGHPGGSDTTGTGRPEGTDAAPSADPRRSGEVLPRSAPTRLLIPKIAVDAPFTVLTMGSTGQLAPLRPTTPTSSAGTPGARRPARRAPRSSRATSTP